MYKFHYGYIKKKYGNNSRLLFVNTDSLMYENKSRDVCKDCSNDKEMFDFSNYSTKSKYCHNLKKLVVGRMKDTTTDVAIEEFARLNPKMYSYLVDDNSEHEKANDVKKNVTATISHNEYKIFLLNKRCFEAFNELDLKKRL